MNPSNTQLPPTFTGTPTELHAEIAQYLPTHDIATLSSLNWITHLTYTRSLFENVEPYHLEGLLSLAAGQRTAQSSAAGQSSNLSHTQHLSIDLNSQQFNGRIRGPHHGTAVGGRARKLPRRDQWAEYTNALQTVIQLCTNLQSLVIKNMFAIDSFFAPLGPSTRHCFSGLRSLQNLRLTVSPQVVWADFQQFLLNALPLLTALKTLSIETKPGERAMNVMQPQGDPNTQTRVDIGSLSIPLPPSVEILKLCGLNLAPLPVTGPPLSLNTLEFHSQAELNPITEFLRNPRVKASVRYLTLNVYGYVNLANVLPSNLREIRIHMRCSDLVSTLPQVLRLQTLRRLLIAVNADYQVDFGLLRDYFYSFVTSTGTNLSNLASIVIWRHTQIRVEATKTEGNRVDARVLRDFLRQLDIKVAALPSHPPTPQELSSPGTSTSGSSRSGSHRRAALLPVYSQAGSSSSSHLRRH